VKTGYICKAVAPECGMEFLSRRSQSLGSIISSSGFWFILKYWGRWGGVLGIPVCVNAPDFLRKEVELPFLYLESLVGQLSLRFFGEFPDVVCMGSRRMCSVV
jgi:hypothetical protein